MPYSISRAKSIIHVVGHLDHHIGGPRASLIALIKKASQQIDAEHYLIWQFDTNTDHQEFERELGGPVCRARSGHLALYDYWVNLLSISRRTSDSIIHVHGIYGLYPIIAILFARIYRIKCILSPRGMTLRLQNLSLNSLLKRLVVAIINRLLAKSGTIHGTSDQEIELFASQFSHFRVIKESSANFDFGGDITPDYKPRERPYIIYLGRISSSKNVDNLILAWLSLTTKQKKNCQLLLVGPLDNEFEYSANKLLELRVHGIIYEGAVYDTEKKMELLSQSRYLVNFSVSENFGHSIFEALCLGIPVIVSKSTPWKEVEIFGAGIVFDPNHVEFSDVLVDCLGKDDDDLSKSAAAAKTFVSNYKSVNETNLNRLYEFRHV